MSTERLRSVGTLLVLLVLLLGGCATRVAAPAGPESTAEAAQAAWARLLWRHVDEQGRVDFAAIARNPADLHLYLRFVAATPLHSLDAGNARLAHMINAYNALALFNVIDSGLPASHDGWNKLDFFVLKRLPVGGQQLSLYAFENDLIRPYALSLGDPRVHFALNCMARSCPLLPRVPFEAHTLQGQLQHETLAFFARPQNFRIDAAARTVWLSELLDFYADDFVPLAAPSLLDYANRYAPAPAPAGYALRFTPYDWRVVHAPAPR